jgi:predicted nuclease of restriction endonuclease-like RecB superfamily
VSDRLKSKGWTVAQEPRLVDVDGNTLIPDIVAIRDQRAVIIDPMIVYENTPTSE